VGEAAAAWAGRRVALVHDWLTGMRGGEKVLESLCRLFPDAPLFTLVHKRGAVSALIESRPIRTSIVQRLPGAAERYRHYLPAFPAAIELFDLDRFDLVISTSHCAAKSVVVPGRAVHVCYCHSPMRYAWDQFPHYFGAARVGALRNALLRPALAALARWDRDTAHRVDHYVANSRYVAGRIARYYNRQVSVLHPPVDTDFFSPGDAPPEPYFLVVSALVPYKRLETAIRAAALAGVPLKIVGTGPDRDRLRTAAGSGVEFLGPVPDDVLRALYRRAQAVLLPGEEDFGIVPVEAMACGRPVIALGRGGACETVHHGVSGLLVETDTPEAFAGAMRQLPSCAFDPLTLRSHAAAFGLGRFETAFAGLIADALHAPAC
jgi:glycosyltransferase involved in cell wall biosynthesis